MGAERGGPCPTSRRDPLCGGICALELWLGEAEVPLRLSTYPGLALFLALSYVLTSLLPGGPHLSSTPSWVLLSGILT